MVQQSWRSPTAVERALVRAWTQRWNEQIGDNALVTDDLVVRASCSCGACPSFSATPLTIDPARAAERPLAVEAEGRRSDGGLAAGLIAWGLDNGVVDFEVYSLAGDPVTLEELTFTFLDATRGPSIGRGSTGVD